MTSIGMVGNIAPLARRIAERVKVLYLSETFQSMPGTFFPIGLPSGAASMQRGFHHGNHIYQ